MTEVVLFNLHSVLGGLRPVRHQIGDNPLPPHPGLAQHARNSQDIFSAAAVEVVEPSVVEMGALETKDFLFFLCHFPI